eukprot:CAMPEP_0176467018 /NCGR_PEP_ID=MMETSP0127-20121128/38225_1 /TAXON_ID=938130 /ORGANISM="Platyophrya macrostoma, Strain WH" /LENGTH=462 /DNA_ID=CAMNT_0017860271 /DNA_START=21 /DNA_END=1409 /DNA_ORIENTATION=-
MLKIKFLAFIALLALACSRLQVEKKPLNGPNELNPVNSNVTYNTSNLINTTQLGINFTGEFRTGYITVNQTTQSKYFYWLYAAGGSTKNTSVNDSAPVILWMQGGPGCADGTGQFDEIGPYTIANVSGVLQTVPAAISWNDKYHLIFIDNPVGVGYSVGTEPIYSSDTVAQYVETFLLELFKLFPNLGLQPLYVFGESYGGHYGPAVVSRLIANNNNTNINITGLGIVDGWVNPYYQATAYAEYAYAAGLIDPYTRDQMMKAEEKVKEAFFNQEHAQVASLWGQVTDFINGLNLNVYNYRMYTDTDSLGSPYALWLNNNTIKQGLGVDSSVYYNDCVDMHGSFDVDLGTSFNSKMEYILSSTSPAVKVLVMNGADDFIVNSAGVERYIRTLNWPGAAGWINTNKTIWKSTTDPNYVWGTLKQYGNFTYALVNKAGHEVPMYTPDSARDLLERFITDKWTNKK